MRTYTPKPGDITREWYVIDATDVVLGRLATQAATLLRGKHKPTFAPHVDGGDFVIIINAEKVALTGNKREQKMAYRHSGYPGGLQRDLVRRAAREQPAPRRREGRRRACSRTTSSAVRSVKKLKVYAGAEHPHAAQQPKPFEITQVAQ